MSTLSRRSILFILVALLLALLLCGFSPSPKAPPAGYYMCDRWFVGCPTYNSAGERLTTHKLYRGEMTKFVEFEYVIGFGYQGISQPTPWSLKYRYRAADFRWAAYNDK